MLIICVSLVVLATANDNIAEPGQKMICFFMGIVKDMPFVCVAK